MITRARPATTRDATRCDRITFVAAGVVFAAWMLDAGLAPTTLVTPIDSASRSTVVAVGVVFGLWLTRVVHRREQGRIAADQAQRKGARTTIGTVALTATLLGAMAGDHAARRVAEAVTFHDSRTPMIATAFAIRGVSGGKSGPSATISPAGAPRNVPISRADAALLQVNDGREHPLQYCLTLRRQATATAVRIWVPSRPRRSDARVTVAPCPAAARPVG